MDSQALRTLAKKRTTNFREDETRLLIQLWGSPQIQNKLYLTHRKAPVMRLLAANMQQRGFYRTPDEIKTRIRNLKCLYHRIKRTVQSGTGLGTVDPDWPHYKAMDDIFNRQNNKKDIYHDNVFEGPRCEDIKQEIDDIDINDDMESYTTNSVGSDYEEDSIQMPPLTPAPKDVKKEKKDQTESKEAESTPPKISIPAVPKLPAILPNVTIPISMSNAVGNSTIKPTTTSGTIPFPLLILNGLSNQQVLQNNKTIGNNQDKDGKGNMKNTSSPNMSEVASVLKELLDIQKEQLQIDKQRLELEKQKLEFERLVGSQLLTIVPVFGGILQKMSAEVTAKSHKKNGNKRKLSADIDSKILRNMLEQGIKKYVMGEESDKSDISDHEDHDESSNEEEK